jgi:RNA polymerase sigma-70 factor (TIGR02960 family)
VSDVEAADVAAASAGDERAFERIVARHRRELHAHCYRMLGSVHDADDALQDALLGAWRGLPAFEGRSSLRSWLFRVATHAAIRTSQRRGRRIAGREHGRRNPSVHELGTMATEVMFIEPYPDRALRDVATDPAARLDALESVELAFVAAVQTLPPRQRAVLLLRDVVALSAAEVAATLDTTVASVNSALQRARETVAGRSLDVSQQAARRALGDDGQRRLVEDLIAAWERHDIDGIVSLLAADARLSMPPLPAWFEGRDAVAEFFRVRIFASDWRLLPIGANGQLAVAGYMGDGPSLPRAGIIVVTVRDGAIAALDSFVDPVAAIPFDIPVAVDR